MSLKNAFGYLALDQSVMCTTPLLKAINTTLLSTPYVYVVNEGPQQVWLATPATINVNLANVSTPVYIQNVNIINPATPTATPIVQFMWPPFLQVWEATPAVRNVNIANPSTPTATPIVVVASMPPISVTAQMTPGTQVWLATPLVVNVNVANPSTPTATPIVNIASMPPITTTLAPGTQIWLATPQIVNVNIANPSTPTATPIVIIASQPPITVTFPAIQNVNVANQATPTATPIVQFIWPNPLNVYDRYISGTPINVNVANVSTPPAVQVISGTVNIGSTPIVSLANTQVAVQNWPLSQNVNIINAATPTATPIVQFIWPPFLQVWEATPAIRNVNIANVSTPPAIQTISGTVSIGSTPIVSLANTQVAVQNWPISQNVNLITQSTPTATPIVQFIWPNPLFVYDKSIASTPLNVNIANVSTPPYIQNVNVINPSTPTATPIVILGGISGNYINVNDVFDNATPTHRVETGQGRSLLFAPIGATVNGDNIITPGIASNRIKVVSYVLMAAAPVNVRWGSSTPLKAKSGVFPLIANTGVSAVGQVSSHLLETNAGESLALSLDAAVNVGGHVAYFVEP